MKTAEQKAEEFIRKMSLRSYRHLLIEGLVKLIEDVDRDARLACADAVMECPYTSGDWVLMADARAAIINTKAV